MHDPFVQQHQLRFQDAFSRRDITGWRDLTFHRFEVCRSHRMQQFQSGLRMRQNPKETFVIRCIVADFDDRAEKNLVDKDEA